MQSRVSQGGRGALAYKGNLRTASHGARQCAKAALTALDTSASPARSDDSYIYGSRGSSSRTSRTRHRPVEHGPLGTRSAAASCERRKCGRAMVVGASREILRGMRLRSMCTDSRRISALWLNEKISKSDQVATACGVICTLAVAYGYTVALPR